MDDKTKTRNVTLADVAARAGVSSITASRAARRPETVSPELRARVGEAIEGLGYVRNQLASSLASTQTGLVGVIVPSLTNGVFADYLASIHDHMHPRGLQVMVLNARYSAETEERAIATLIGHHVEAMIVTGIDQTERSLRLLRRSRMPVVQTMELCDSPLDLNLGLSQYEAGFAATRHLISLGNKRIGHLSARLDQRSQRRHLGYVAALKNAKRSSSALVVSTPSPSTVSIGAELFRELIAKAPDLDAIFCCNDDLALGALFECQRRGIRVPDQVSILGFNDLDLSAQSCPAISSVGSVLIWPLAQLLARLLHDTI
jgi:LacI family gluconate utilization system Gnt-I transcriptional repressor